jgi:hypothetical protein
MKDIREKLENWMMAVAFAEAGEHETALEFVKTKQQKNRKKRIHKEISRRPDNRPRLEC